MNNGMFLCLSIIIHPTKVVFVTVCGATFSLFSQRFHFQLLRFARGAPVNG